MILSQSEGTGTFLSKNKLCFTAFLVRPLHATIVHSPPELCAHSHTHFAVFLTCTASPNRSSLLDSNFGAGRHSHAAHQLDQALLPFFGCFCRLFVVSRLLPRWLPSLACYSVFHHLLSPPQRRCCLQNSCVSVCRTRALAALETPRGGLGFETGRCPGGARGELSLELRNQMLRSGLVSW